MTSGWYYAKAGAPAGHEVGPFSWEELYLLAQAGTITPADLVWNPKLPHGVTAGQVPNLFPGSPLPSVPAIGPEAVTPSPPPQPLAPSQPPPTLKQPPPALQQPEAPQPPPSTLAPDEPTLSKPTDRDTGAEAGPRPEAVDSKAPDVLAQEELADNGARPEKKEPTPGQDRGKHRNLPWLLVLLALVIAAAGLAAYFLFLRDTSDGQDGTSAAGSTTTTASVSTTTPPPAVAPPGEWTELSPLGTAPSARKGHALAYDPLTSRTILFGGSHLDTKLGDTWGLDLATRSWTLIAPSGDAPSARHYQQLVYDAVGGRMILFGGEDASGDRNDTWAFDPSTDTWTELRPAGDLPPPRYGHAMAYDSDSRRVIVFGGLSKGSKELLNDLWAYDVSADSWARLEPSGALPVKRMWHSLVYDPASRRVILFGGYGGSSGKTGANLADLWAYDPATDTWTELRATGSPPVARLGHAMLLDPRSGDLFLHGGSDGLTGLRDAWSLDPAAYSWSKLEPSGGTPAGRDSHALAYDAVHSVVVLFGGYDFAEGFDFDDTWVYGTRSTGEAPFPSSGPG